MDAIVGASCRTRETGGGKKIWWPHQKSLLSGPILGAVMSVRRQLPVEVYLNIIEGTWGYTNSRGARKRTNCAFSREGRFSLLSLSAPLLCVYSSPFRAVCHLLTCSSDPYFARNAITEARDIRSAEKNGHLDPYVRVKTQTRDGKTSDVLKTAKLRNTSHPQVCARAFLLLYRTAPDKGRYPRVDRLHTLLCKIF